MITITSVTLVTPTTATIIIKQVTLQGARAEDRRSHGAPPPARVNTWLAGPAACRASVAWSGRREGRPLPSLPCLVHVTFGRPLRPVLHDVIGRGANKGCDIVKSAMALLGVCAFMRKGIYCLVLDG